MSHSIAEFLSKFINIIIGNILKRNLYQKFTDDEPVEKQKFSLFRIFSLAGCVICAGVALKMIWTIENFGLLPLLIISLGFLLLINFLISSELKYLKLHYAVMLGAAVILLHVVSYSCGGIKTAGTFYFGAIILYAFMLLGKKGGSIFTAIILIHVIYLFIVSTFTDLTSFNFFNNDNKLINEDFIINAVLSFLLIAFQGSYLQGGKNEVIEKLEKQASQLTEKAHQLENSNKKLNLYSKNLEKKNAELLKFASIAYHDLKAPLRAIGSLSDIIQEEEIHIKQESKKHFLTIKNRVSRLENLLNALLEYSLISEPKSKPCKIQSGKTLQNIAIKHATNDKINIKLEGDLPDIYMIKEHFEKLFNVLLSNAINFNHNSEVNIHISGITRENIFEFSVKDNGPGIDERFHGKIFEIFQTLNPRDEFESTGAGLAIAKKITDYYGGTISVESGNGWSNFICTFPKTNHETIYYLSDHLKT